MMELNNLKSKKHELYSVSINYLNKIDSVEFDMNNFIVENHSISYVIDHEFIPVPSIKIQLSLKGKNEIISNNYYCLYLNDKMDFIDEFLVIN
jgi:hypothetical protein